MTEETGAGVYGQSVGRRLSFSLGRYATIFQAKIYAILACVHEIQVQNRSEKYVSICSDSHAALKALQAVRTSPLVLQCQRALNDISLISLPGMQWGSSGSLDMLEYEVMRSQMGSRGAAQFGGFLDPSQPRKSLGKKYKNGLSRWLFNQRWARWRGLGNTQRQARDLISGPSLGAKAKFLSCNRTQARVVTGLLTGHNTLRRHLHLLELVDSPMCRRCAMEEETLAHILCECEALASLRHMHLGSFFLESQDIQSMSLGAIWDFSKVTGLPRSDGAQRACL